MNIQPECAPCLIKRVIYESNLVDKSKVYEAIRLSAKILGEEYGPSANSARVATKIHGAVYKLLNSRDVYKEVKARSNAVALKMLPKVREKVESSNDPFKSAVICSIVGNNLDFGIGSSVETPEELEELFDRLWGSGLGHDDTSEIKAMLERADKVLLFTDNCGEIVFDTLLIEELKRFDIHLTLVVKGEPILTDATLEEVESLGLDKLVDDVETTNAFAVGVDFGKIAVDLKRKLEEADLIICKGMANWESFSDEDYKPIAYLLRAKCAPIARSLGVEKDTNVAKLYK